MRWKEALTPKGTCTPLAVRVSTLGRGDRLKKGVSILGVRGQAKERGCHPGGGKG